MLKNVQQQKTSKKDFKNVNIQPLDFNLEDEEWTSIQIGITSLCVRQNCMVS